MNITEQLVNSINNMTIDDKVKPTTNEQKGNDTIELKNKVKSNIDVDRLFMLFINKYQHLNNYNNRKNIYMLCEMTINVFITKQTDQFYLNFLESTINETMRESSSNMDIIN